MAHGTTSVINEFLRPHLLARRERLENSSAAAALPHVEVVRLLREIDRALDQMEAEAYGICEFCHTPIEEERLLSNPLARTCLEHMSGPELHALQQDLDLAVRIQTGMLPKCELSMRGWEACYHYAPLGAVSGDFCDLSAIDGRMFFLVGDVSGKGVSASLLMSHLNAIFRSLLTVGMPVRELMLRVNRIFCEATRPPYYATLVCGFASDGGEIELVNAGHCPPLMLHNGDARRIEATGLPVGLFGEANYESLRLHLQPGEFLALYTDGISEACNAAGDEFGLERLAVALRAHQESALGRIQSCLEQVEAFRGAAAKTDDVTIAVIQRAS